MHLCLDETTEAEAKENLAISTLLLPHSTTLRTTGKGFAGRRLPLVYIEGNKDPKCRSTPQAESPGIGARGTTAASSGR
jgi:hypothetical protein